MFALIALTNCTTHTVKLGKKCTQIASDSTYEKSFVWVVKKETCLLYTSDAADE